jgi:hypothetical protein
LTETFTSARYGYAIAYPAGWRVTPAAELIDRDVFAAGGEGEWVDVFAPTDTDGLFRIASVPVPEGVNAAEWIAEIYLRCTGTCFEGLTDAVFDGQPALVREDNLEREMILIVGDRAYFATLFPGPEVGLPYAPELFQALMATLDLRPEDAEVQPSPSVGAPAIGQRFVSTIHAVALSYPVGWVTRAATKPWTTQDLPYFQDDSVDVMYDPALTDHMFLAVSSQSHAGTTREAWATALAAGEEGCEIELMEWDGGTAWIAPGCRLFFVAESDIGWAIRLYASDLTPAQDPAYDRLFEEILGTVQLHARPAGG